VSGCTATGGAAGILTLAPWVPQDAC
jgi:hypothetical protein